MPSFNSLWSVKEAAEYLKCHEITVRRMIYSGELKARKIGRSVRIDPRDVARVGRPVKVYAGSRAGEADA